MAFETVGIVGLGPTLDWNFILTMPGYLFESVTNHILTFWDLGIFGLTLTVDRNVISRNVGLSPTNDLKVVRNRNLFFLADDDRSHLQGQVEICHKNLCC